MITDILFIAGTHTIMFILGIWQERYRNKNLIIKIRDKDVQSPDIKEL